MPTHVSIQLFNHVDDAWADGLRAWLEAGSEAALSGQKVWMVCRSFVQANWLRRQFLFFRSEQMIGHFAEIPDDAEPGEEFQRVVGDIDFPPEKALAGGGHEMMVVVVPAFAQGDQGQEEIVAAGIRDYYSIRS